MCHCSRVRPRNVFAQGTLRPQLVSIVQYRRPVGGTLYRPSNRCYLNVVAGKRVLERIDGDLLEKRVLIRTG